MDDIYAETLESARVKLPIAIDKDTVTERLRSSLASTREGVCGVNGYVEPGSLAVVGYSAPRASQGELEFEVSFKYRACMLPEGTVLELVVNDVTKAGIRATLPVKNSPAVVFVARDHHNTSSEFADAGIGKRIEVTVIAQRYEKGDTQVSAIASLNRVLGDEATPTKLQFRTRYKK